MRLQKIAQHIFPSRQTANLRMTTPISEDICLKTRNKGEKPKE